MVTKLTPEMKKALKVRDKKEKELERKLFELRKYAASLIG